MKHLIALLTALLMLAACEQKKPGPETYYDYRGRHLGTQYMLAQRLLTR